MRKTILSAEDPDSCSRMLLAIQDTIDLIGGKWKVKIIGTLAFGKKHFLDLERDIVGIRAKMLSKELKDLEINGMVTRTVIESSPKKVEYELTAYGRTLEPIIRAMAQWGDLHRQRFISKV